MAGGRGELHRGIPVGSVVFLIASSRAARGRLWDRRDELDSVYLVTHRILVFLARRRPVLPSQFSHDPLCPDWGAGVAGHVAHLAVASRPDRPSRLVAATEHS